MKRIVKFLYWLGKKIDRDSLTPFEGRVEIIDERYTIQQVSATIAMDEILSGMPRDSIKKILIAQMEPFLSKYITIIDTEFPGCKRCKVGVLKIAVKK